MTEDMSKEEIAYEPGDDDDDETETFVSAHPYIRDPHWLKEKNQAEIEEFLGNQGRLFKTGKLPWYYRELLAWALHQYLERNSWKIVTTLGYREPEPVHTDVNTGEETCYLLVDGQMLIKKNDNRYALTVDIIERRLIQIEGPENKKEEMTRFIDGVLQIAGEENFYRAKRIEFNQRIRFLDVMDKSWQSVVLDAQTKTEIRANTIGFLRQSERWIKYNIPLKRGVLLAGEPGTGKTIICRALMAEAVGITCITTSSYFLDGDACITDLYKLAEDLSPCIVFIEDIDLIGQDRLEFGYQRGPALLSLLSVLDGIEEKKNIVTVATTNCLEILDKTLSQRPSRFDLIIKISLPSPEQRRELISLICRQIPLDEQTQRYIALKAEKCTPAQIQEIIYSLVILNSTEQGELKYSNDYIDRAISRLNHTNKYRLGFDIDNGHNGSKHDLSRTVK